MSKFVGLIDASASRRDAAYIRHYNFADFERMGAQWEPIYINIVRDPVEKVRISKRI